jgi:hypothetical protein
MERNRKNYTEVAVFGFYVPSLWSAARALQAGAASYDDGDFNHRHCQPRIADRHRDASGAAPPLSFVCACRSRHSERCYE